MAFFSHNMDSNKYDNNVGLNADFSSIFRYYN